MFSLILTHLIISDDCWAAHFWKIGRRHFYIAFKLLKLYPFDQMFDGMDQFLVTRFLQNIWTYMAYREWQGLILLVKEHGDAEIQCWIERGPWPMIADDLINARIPADYWLWYPGEDFHIVSLLRMLEDVLTHGQMIAAWSDWWHRKDSWDRIFPYRHQSHTSVKLINLLAAAGQLKDLKHESTH